MEGESGWKASRDTGAHFSFTLPLLSLEKLLAPVMVKDGRLADSLMLIRVELQQPWTPAASNWNDLRDRCREMLRACILPAKDVLLPMLETGPDETFLIVAATDENGADVLTRRIRGQFERTQELKPATFKVSAAAIQLPPREAGKTVDTMVREVADNVTAMAMGALRPKPV
jgi:hypothetical protein